MVRVSVWNGAPDKLFQVLTDDVAFNFHMHFGDKAVEMCSCQDCEDYKGSVCPGRGLSGKAVMGCMREKAQRGDIGFF